MKVVFIQNKGKSFGGVWQVNKTVGEALIKEGVDVTILSIMENKTDYEPEYDKRLHVETLDKDNIWETYSWSEVISDLKRLNLSSAIKKINNRLNNNRVLKRDKKLLSDYLDKLNPNYIVSSQYQILDMLPKKYLPITYDEQHSSFRDSWKHKGTRKVLEKYKDKVTYIWLCKNTMQAAINHGLTKSICIYNAVRFESEKKADVVNNKKLVTIARIDHQKRIDKMVDIIEEVFNDKKYADWTLEIWGSGDEYNLVKSMITSPQIKLMGRTNDPKSVLLSSSINLITSDFEGFALSILEANECGIPTITLDFGESTSEQFWMEKLVFLPRIEMTILRNLR